MSKKKILIGFPSSLLPVIGMSQVRTIEQMKRLRKDFIIDLAFIGRKKDELKLYDQKLKDICNEIFFLQHPKFKSGGIIRAIRTVRYKLIYYLTGKPPEYQLTLNKELQKRIIELVNNKGYDLFLIHYWYLGIVFPKISLKVKKAIDTHYVVQENLEIFNNGLYEHINTSLQKKELEFSVKKQNEYFSNTDILIFNSQRQAELIKNLFPHKHLIVTKNGQEVEKFLDYKSGDPDSVLLFYGSLSNQFNKKAIKILIDIIIPGIKAKVSDLKVMFVGAGPPEWLSKLHNDTDFIVTGFVEDIKPVISKCYLSVLPLSTASGFRGRAIELMALGVPLIGTHNALDSIGLTHGQDGYITDDVDEMISLASDLFHDRSMRQRISLNGKKLVSENYNLEATFGELARELITILGNNNNE